LLRILLTTSILLTSMLITKVNATTWERAKQLSATQNVVLIDESEQSLTVLRNGKGIYSTKIVTGKIGNQTDKGEFKINYKATNAKFTLYGETYVDYWMPYNGNEGMHDAWWRDDWEFGVVERWKTKGSHGCTNLSRAAAEKIFGLVVKGTPVIVIR
jgi:lipoprotein-anchoring transpeptidase ErfK/SrfK